MTEELSDDELLALYLETDDAAERDRIAGELVGRGIDADELSDLAAVLDDGATWDEPAADLGDRIMAGIAAPASPLKSPPQRAPQPAPQPAPLDAPVVDLAQRRAQRRGAPLRKVMPVVAAVAAAAAIGVGVGRISRESAPEFDAQVALAATPLAPGAQAEVRVRTESAGVRIELEATNLPEPPVGFIYEAWVTDGTIRIPIGTFSKGGSVVLWSGVPVDRYPTMTVTLEPVDADASSSGKVVLKGAIAPR